MATLDDILTTQKNGVNAINNLGQALKLYNEGQFTSATVTATTLIATGSGRLVNVAVVVKGSADGFIHNASSTGLASLSNRLCATPTAASGVYLIGSKFTNGLVIAPGTGQALNVTYSLD